MDKELLKAIGRLKGYRKAGFMNVGQIDEVIEILGKAYKESNEIFTNRLMDEVVDYYASALIKEKSFTAFVKGNMDYVAEVLKRSKRTIYRKLQNNTFTLIEKKKIEDKMDDFFRRY